MSSLKARTIEQFKRDRLGQIGILIIVSFIAIGLFAPWIAPLDPDERYRGDDGSVLRMTAPTADHFLGTTHMGNDVISQVIYGTRVTLLVGGLAAFMAVFIGTNIGLISAYYGGWVDNALMRLVDLAYGLPFLPFIIVLVFIMGPDIMYIIIAIALIMWRSTARVIRSQVLSLKERPYIESAIAAGASDLRIMYRHILPNVIPIAFLYAAFSIAWAVIAEASVAFLGYGDPTLHSWGKMLFEAYRTDAIRSAWWWVLPPGVSLMLFVMSVFFIGRALENITNPELRHRE